ncbi:unnamed protein product (macronuclear) [Paramecium tetraurelia]|uniref:Protein kinase domain-containing protein n=1 Tax=Paramecium tetraurelia TaxID=5888 RepID=A0D1B0_PARTE|nr:uncharacterized protein GSPATT00012351001 [Paramecium tetraurelia]CAK76827.1 unnamed protein product [Paramecium tetraurelia]|eukprot:XP_001444224.1 hypothetical protein (macronuclear) [Paramecium tetraurelia strain d4-2]
MLDQLSQITLNESSTFETQRLPPRLQTTEKKGSGRFTFLKSESDDKQTQAQNNRDRIKQQLRGRIQLIIKKPLNDEKDLYEELQELGRKLDVEINEFDSEYICPNLKKFDEDYEMMEILGEGCLGLVKRIVHKQSQIEYAVKIVQTQDDEIIRNMILEFKSMFKLQHENIVKVHKLYIDFNDGFQSESKAHVVMELIKGKEMFEVINELGHYSESDAKELFKQLLSAIEYMHRNGICHRDLKPNNILCVENKNQIKVTDFNVNLKDREKIEMWTYTGTVAFSAPEIFSGEGYNQMVDMWSAGCILYSMLSGQLPFLSDYLNDLIEKIKEAAIEFPNDLFEQVSEEAKDLIIQLLQKDWTFRPHPDAALKHQWFQIVDDDQVRKKSLRKLAIRKNMPRLSSKYSKNSHKQRNILLGSSQTITIKNNRSVDSKCDLQQADSSNSFLKIPTKKSIFFSTNPGENKGVNQNSSHNQEESPDQPNSSNLSDDIGEFDQCTIHRFVNFQKQYNVDDEVQEEIK